ncbi:hypothetical protein C7M84_001824 [Penaeus vannamei]|uniref:Uncharacterized protein n=1 Tax=Penaeus vannamei TaxID=6689 RepID=A0A423TSL6_PENVA|nr:hypothetical protein C7M84_001824 [Penaeus vannamei]
MRPTRIPDTSCSIADLTSHRALPQLCARLIPTNITFTTNPEISHYHSQSLLLTLSAKSIYPLIPSLLVSLSDVPRHTYPLSRRPFALSTPYHQFHSTRYRQLTRAFCSSHSSSLIISPSELYQPMSNLHTCLTVIATSPHIIITLYLITHSSLYSYSSDARISRRISYTNHILIRSSLPYEATSMLHELAIETTSTLSRYTLQCRTLSPRTPRDAIIPNILQLPVRSIRTHSSIHSHAPTKRSTPLSGCHHSRPIDVTVMTASQRRTLAHLNPLSTDTPFAHTRQHTTTVQPQALLEYPFPYHHKPTNHSIPRTTVGRSELRYFTPQIAYSYQPVASSLSSHTSYIAAPYTGYHHRLQQLQHLTCLLDTISYRKQNRPLLSTYPPSTPSRLTRDANGQPDIDTAALPCVSSRETTKFTISAQSLLDARYADHRSQSRASTPLAAPISRMRINHLTIQLDLCAALHLLNTIPHSHYQALHCPLYN